jgi:hypothetical protein
MATLIVSTNSYPVAAPVAAAGSEHPAGRAGAQKQRRQKGFRTGTTAAVANVAGEAHRQDGFAVVRQFGPRCEQTPQRSRTPASSARRSWSTRRASATLSMRMVKNENEDAQAHPRSAVHRFLI